MVSRRWLYAGGAATAALLAVVAALLGVADAVSVLAGSTGAQNAVLAAVGALIEWFAAVLVFAVLSVALFAAAAVSALRRVSVPRDDRLAGFARRLERWVPPLRRFDAADRVAPTTDDRREELTERYVDGDVTEAEFERELDGLLDEEVEYGRERS